MKTTPEVIIQDTVKGADYYHCSAEKTWTGVSSFATRRTGTTRNVCPRMKRRYLVDIGFSSFESSLHDGGSIAVTDHSISNGWYTLLGVFSCCE